ncbi:dapper homolog 3-like [Schistocerca piceifrons]|uniref:dapper homolog 3-like n=1 Tax=Schistocerca piceifrons TaxID=274613 RepID=UPI001F5E5C12|nr:dapper homolog 3-like [Schistocerca piceifrons]
MYLLDEWRNHSHGNNRSRRLEPLAQLGEPGRYLGAPSSRPRPPHAAPPGPAALIPAERTQPRAGEPASSAAAGVTTAAIRHAAAPSHVSPTFPSAIARGEGPSTFHSIGSLPANNHRCGGSQQTLHSWAVSAAARPVATRRGERPMPRHSSARAFGARGSSLSLHKRPLAAREIRPPPRKSYIKRARPGSAGDKVTLRARAGRRPPASRRGARVKARRFTAGHNVEAGGGGRGRGANKSVRAGRGLPKSPPRGPARPRKFARCPPLIEETADYSIRTRVSRPGLSALPCPCPEGLRARVSGGECLPAWPLPSPRLPLPPPSARLFTEELLPAVPRLALFLCPPD